MNKRRFQEIVTKLLPQFGRKLPDHVSEDPFRVLIGCILSTRTRDEFTDKAYGALFAVYPTVEELSAADIEQIAALIKPVNFYKTKAKRVKEAATWILHEYGGKVPSGRVELLKVPGIGPKCADIVLSFGFGLDTVAVDTHVEVVAKRLGVAPPDAKYDEIQEKLQQVAAPGTLADLNDLFVAFGQKVCLKHVPKCNICPVYDYCVWEGKTARRRQLNSKTHAGTSEKRTKRGSARTQRSATV
ncbi:MAG: endonuclease III [Thermoprotei archaeon]